MSDTLTPAGAKIEPLSLPPAEMDFVKTYEDVRDHVFSMFGVPDYLLVSTALGKMLEEIAENLEGWSLYLIAADCAEDGGRRDLADCLRWLAREKKRPYHGTSWNGSETLQGWHWYQPEKKLGSSIPLTLFLCVTDGKRFPHRREFPSPRAALEAVFVAWPKAIAAGWSPNQ